MAFRGGRGRGRGGFGGGYVKAEPFEIFPKETKLPDPKSISTDPKLVSSFFNFQKFWRDSPYHLGDGVSKQESESLDIERFSDSLKPKSKSKKSGSFYDYLVLRPDNFPKELLGDTRRERPLKRAKWSQEADLQKLDVLAKLEEAEGKEQKEEGEDDEVEESDGEESDNGDYDQNQDFDDDDDDYNQDDGGDFEEVY